MINIVKDLSVKHVLIFVIIAFLLYHIIGNCGYRDGFSVGGQKCSEYDTKVACDGPCKWDDNTNTCSEKSEFCKVNSLCSDGSKCPDCGATYCECPPPGYCDCQIKIFPGGPLGNDLCFNYLGGFVDTNKNCPGVWVGGNYCTKYNNRTDCENKMMSSEKSDMNPHGGEPVNLCKWHIK